MYVKAVLNKKLVNKHWIVTIFQAEKKVELLKTRLLKRCSAWYLSQFKVYFPNSYQLWPLDWLGLPWPILGSWLPLLEPLMFLLDPKNHLGHYWTCLEPSWNPLNSPKPPWTLLDYLLLKLDSLWPILEFIWPTLETLETFYGLSRIKNESLGPTLEPIGPPPAPSPPGSGAPEPFWTPYDPLEPLKDFFMSNRTSWNS